MSTTHRCILNPNISQDEARDPLSAVWVTPERARAVEEKRPYLLAVALTNKCAASCGYCYSSSTAAGEYVMPREKVLELIDEGKSMNIPAFALDGGEALLHPNWYEFASYAIDQGLKCDILTSGMITKEDARRICQLGDAIECVGVHIDTINQDVYNKVHTNPATLEKRIQGYRYLLEAGYPPEKVMACLTFTKPASEVIEETVDWYVDEMGVKAVLFVPFKPEGFARQHLEWEPGLSDVKRAVEYRAKKLGSHWLRIGSSDGSRFICQGQLYVTFDGRVMGCAILYDLAVGNVFEESLKDIYEKNRDELIFNFEIKGACGNCENNDVCFGCRATAYTYLGDVRESDPKCYLNPEAKEYYFKDAT